jgi:hypothetical protein
MAANSTVRELVFTVEYRKTNLVMQSNAIAVRPKRGGIWQIDIKGNIIKHIRDETQDAFHFGAVDAAGNFQIRQVKEDNGNMADAIIRFEYGTVTDQYEYPLFVNEDGRNIKKEVTVFEIKGDDNATKLFEYLADTEKATIVEWVHIKIGTEISEKNMIGTSHQEKDSIVNFYGSNRVRELNHNHPTGKPFPSDADIETAKDVSKKNSNAQFNIYISNPKTYMGFDLTGKPFRKK